MYSDFEGPAPFDSHDLYEMGLRPARCNGCKYARLRWLLGDKFLHLNKNGWVAVYELDAEPVRGQGEPMEHAGRPIRHRVSFMSIGHSDECYHWSPPKGGEEARLKALAQDKANHEAAVTMLKLGALARQRAHRRSPGPKRRAGWGQKSE